MGTHLSREAVAECLCARFNTASIYSMAKELSKNSAVSKREAKQAQQLSKLERAEIRREAPNPVWFKPLMFGFMLLGLIWIVVYYITATTAMPLPIPSLGQGNIFVGFGLVLVGFMLTPWWK